jgi:hypothetical protein
MRFSSDMEAHMADNTTTQTAETWAEEIARLGREIGERQARLQFLLCGDPRKSVTVPTLSQEDLWNLYVRS